MKPSKKEALMKTLLYEEATVIHVGEGGRPTTVALVDVEKSATDMKKLETAFMKTNNITDAWWTNEGVTKMFGEATCRSTSVGDMVLLSSGKKYKCEMAGWSEV